MGGYGALRLGLGFTDTFCSVNSHSGALGWATVDFSDAAIVAGKHRDMPRELVVELRRIFGERLNGIEHDLLVHARRAKAAGKLPCWLLDCGTEDFLLSDNHEFRPLLEHKAVPHEYREHTGAHDWDYWDRHVQGALQFHCCNLGIERSPVPRR